MSRPAVVFLGTVKRSDESPLFQLLHIVAGSAPIVLWGREPVYEIFVYFHGVGRWKTDLITNDDKIVLTGADAKDVARHQIAALLRRG